MCIHRKGNVSSVRIVQARPVFLDQTDRAELGRVQQYGIQIDQPVIRAWLQSVKNRFLIAEMKGSELMVLM